MIKNELLTSKVTEGSGTNGSNIMDIAIEEEEDDKCNECFDELFDDEVLDLRRKKQEVSMEQTKKRKFMVVYHHGKLNVLPYNYYFPPMTCSPLIVNCLPGSLYNNVPLLWNFSSKKVTHINNGVRMWNIMKGFMYEVNRLAIDKVCCKSKIKDWGYMSSINV